MKIVVLDGYTLNPGDLDWSGMRAFGDLEVYDRTPSDEIVRRAAEADLVLTNKTLLTAETIGRLPKLKYIGVLATGYNNVDLEAARRRGVPVTNIPDYGTPSVAQHVFAMLLEIANRVRRHDDSVKAGEWSRCPDFCYTKTPLMELAGKTFGVVGLGRIGRKAAEIAAAFGMKVIAAVGRRNMPREAEGIRIVDLRELFRTADVISLHCPLTPETKLMINAEALSLMKPSAILINTARGLLIDERALADALTGGKLAAAALDVLSVEPPPADNPLFNIPNCLITPHIAWATGEARQRLMDIAVENVRCFLNGEPVNVVNMG